MCLMPSAFAIDTAMTSPRALNEPVGSRPSSFTRSSPPPSFAASFGSATIGVIALAEADDVLLAPHRQKFAIAPQIRRPLRQRVFAQRLFHAGEIVTHQQRLAGAGQIMDFVGRIMFAGLGAFEMGDEGFAFGGEVVVGMQGNVSGACVATAFIIAAGTSSPNLSGQALTFDADGNLTSDGLRNYTWDAENRLVGITLSGAIGQGDRFQL